MSATKFHTHTIITTLVFIKFEENMWA
jgi:hypothetical protein